MKIALLTLGTRGDVQPYAILGRALKKHGHDVVLSTGKNFAAMAREYDLEFVAVEADFQALINSEEGKAMMKNPFTAKKHFRTIVQPMMIQALASFFKIAKDSDCVLYHVKSLGDYFADQFPHKMIRANVVPAIRATSEFPNPVFSSLALPRFLNRFTYWVTDLGLAMMNNAIRKFRHNAGLKFNLSPKMPLPEIYGVSECFLKKPNDFPRDSYFTGFWYGESPGELSSDLADFVSNGKKTVVITFGSMPFQAKFDLKESLLVLSNSLNVNIVVVKGWGFEDTSFADSTSIKMIETAPFDKLFPRVHAVVHHGGIGTLSSCLRAGIPSLSCPVIYPMGDQHFWGDHAFTIGCGVKPIPLKKLNHDLLIQNVNTLLSSETLRLNCTKLAACLAHEDGVENVIQIIESRFAKS